MGCWEWGGRKGNSNAAEHHAEDDPLNKDIVVCSEERSLARGWVNYKQRKFLEPGLESRFLLELRPQSTF